MKDRLVKYTGFFILGIVLLVAAYDGYVFMRGGTEVTVSHVVMTWGSKYPITTLAFGILMGHFYWPIRNDLKKKIEELQKENDELKKKLSIV